MILTTPEQVLAVLEAITFGPTNSTFELSLKYYNWAAVDVEVTLAVTEVHSGRRESLSSRRVEMRPPIDAVAVVRQVRDLAIETLTHELDEWIRVAGFDVFNPHIPRSDLMRGKEIQRVLASALYERSRCGR